MEKHTREYLDLGLVHNYLEMVYTLNDSTRHTIDIDKKTFNVFIDRYTMNPNGFHIGWETYELNFPYVKRLPHELNKIILQKYSDHNYIISIDEVDFNCIASPPNEECLCGCDCDSNHYTSPKNDKDVLDSMFEVVCSHFIETLTSSDIAYYFDSNTGEWGIKFNGEYI